MSRAVLNPQIEGTTLDSMVKAKGRGRRKPTLLPAGEVFGRLTATEYFEFRTRPSDGRNRTYQKFVCACGNVVWTIPSTVKSGNTRSCGCLNTDTVKNRKISVTRVRNGETQVFTRDRNHGESKTRLYRKWKSMHARCTNPKYRAWKWYGGKGIRVCEEWADWSTFKEWAIDAGYIDGLELDRIDADGDYSPSNCRWLTKRENVKRARSALSPGVNSMLLLDAQILGVTPENLIVQIVERHYAAAEEALATSTSRGHEDLVTDGKEV